MKTLLIWFLLVILTARVEVVIFWALVAFISIWFGIVLAQRHEERKEQDEDDDE